MQGYGYLGTKFGTEFYFYFLICEKNKLSEKYSLGYSCENYPRKDSLTVFTQHPCHIDLSLNQF